MSSIGVAQDVKDGVNDVDDVVPPLRRQVITGRAVIPLGKGGADEGFTKLTGVLDEILQKDLTAGELEIEGVENVPDAQARTALGERVLVPIAENFKLDLLPHVK